MRAVVSPDGDTLSVDGFAVPLFAGIVRGTHILTPAGA